MRFLRPGIVLSLALTLGLILGACGEDDGEMDGHDMGAAATMMGTMPAMSTAAQGTTGSPTMDHSTMGSPTGDVDMDLAFIDSMIPHHQSAIDMAEVALEEAEHQEIEDLARAIIAAQQAEIDQLRTWRDAWFPGAPDSGGMPGMGGMAGMDMSETDLDELRDADPFDRAFIDEMIPHHESAIMMAQEIQKSTQRPELQQLADAIITAQQGEIEQMQRWRQAWYGS